MLPFLIILVAFFCSTDAAANLSLVCPPGSIPPTHGNDQSLCYMFVNQSKTFDDAEAYCIQQNGHLTTVNDSFTNTFLANQGTNFFSSSQNFWIGAHVVKYMCNAWYWTKNHGFLTYSNWKNPVDGTSPPPGSCASVTVADATWASLSCAQSVPFVCQVPKVAPAPHGCGSGYTYFNETNMCYKRFGYPDSSDLHTFRTSEALCQADGGHLVSIHSSAENTFVSSLAPGRVTSNSMFLWIGASADDNEVYTWTDGTPFDYSNWISGTTASGCTVLFSDGNGDGSYRMQWDSGYSCNGNHFGRFICKKPPAPVS